MQMIVYGDKLAPSFLNLRTLASRWSDFFGHLVKRNIKCCFIKKKEKKTEAQFILMENNRTFSVKFVSIQSSFFIEMVSLVTFETEGSLYC